MNPLGSTSFFHLTCIYYAPVPYKLITGFSLPPCRGRKNPEECCLYVWQGRHSSLPDLFCGSRGGREAVRREEERGGRDSVGGNRETGRKENQEQKQMILLHSEQEGRDGGRGEWRYVWREGKKRKKKKERVRGGRE